MLSLHRKTFTLSEIKRNRDSFRFEWFDSMYNRYTSIR